MDNFKIITGSDKEVEIELNKINETHVINIISFTSSLLYPDDHYIEHNVLIHKSPRLDT